MHSKMLRVFWCAALACAAVFLAGCSHKDETDATDTKKTSTTAPAGGGAQESMAPKPVRAKLGN